MLSLWSGRQRFAVKLFVILSFLFATHSVGASTISGVVYDPFKNPLPDVDVELLDDLHRQVQRSRTDLTGRYSFSNLADGNYNVRVLPFRYDYGEQTQYVEIATLSIRGSGTGNVYEIRDFYLQAKKGSLADAELGVVFAQEVPKNAETLYKTALKDIAGKRTDGAILNLKKAIDEFPKYYLALSGLGRLLVTKGEYSEAAPLLLRAVEVNPKSATSLFYLGLCFQKLNYHKAAITALSEAHVLAPSSVLVLLTLGSAERSEGKYEDAEKHLLKAIKLAPRDVPDIHWELAQLYGLQMKKYKEAAAELERYLKAGEYDEEHTKKIRKLIVDFQDKARRQVNES